jgi:hypothetical protein
MLSYVPPVVAQATPVVQDAGAFDPLFVAVGVGCLAFLWMLIRWIVDDVDLHGDVEDLAPRMSGMPKPGKRDRSREVEVHPLTPRTSVDAPERPQDPQRPERRRRPAA